MSYVIINGRTRINTEYIIKADCEVDPESGELTIDLTLKGGENYKVAGDEALELRQKLFPDPPASRPKRKVYKYGAIVAAPLKTL